MHNGLNKAAAAGIVGNLMQESRLNPTARNSHSGAFGIAQWLGPRLHALEAFAHQHHTSARDFNTQLAFLVHELHGSESRALAALQHAQTPEQAARIFSHKFERAGAHERHDATRIAFARQLYKFA